MPVAPQPSTAGQSTTGRELQTWDRAHDARIGDSPSLTLVATGHIELSPFLCDVLQQTLAKSADQPLLEAYAVAVFARESAHISGIRSPNLAECAAIKTEPRAATLLGLPTTDAVRFQRIYRGTVLFERYHDLICHAGRAGLLVPETLGSPSALRPLQRIAAAVVDALPREWTNKGGADMVGPLSRCAAIADRRLEAARFRISLYNPAPQRFGNDLLDHGPPGYVQLGIAQLRTRQDFANALVRYRAKTRCRLAEDRAYLRQTASKRFRHSVVFAPVPDAITDLSPKVDVRREIWTENGQRTTEDIIGIFDRATRTYTTFEFSRPTGKVSLWIELGAVKAALRALG